MATLVQTDSRNVPPNHTLEDVAEEMLNGILCHYEPPPDRSHEMEEPEGGMNMANVHPHNHHLQHHHHHVPRSLQMMPMPQQQHQPHKQQQRRGILRAPKAWTRRNSSSSKSGKASSKHFHNPFQLQARSGSSGTGSSSKSVRWSDDASDDDEDDDDDDINVKSPRQRAKDGKKKKSKDKKDDASTSSKMFPVEIGCNLSGTCTEVGIEAGCLSPNVETFVYNDDDKTADDGDEGTASNKTKKESGETKRNKAKKSSSSTGRKNKEKAGRGITIVSDDEVLEGDDDDDGDATSSPPPPPPPRRMPQYSTPAPKRSKSSSKSSSSRGRYNKDDEEDADWEDDGDVGNPADKRATPGPTDKTGKGKSGSSSSKSCTGLVAKQYRRPHKEYETTSYDDDLNNSILDEDATDYMGSSGTNKSKKKNGDEGSIVAGRKPARASSSSTKLSSRDMDREETGSTVSNTSSIFQRIWKRGDNTSSSRSLVDSDEAHHQRFGRFRAGGNSDNGAAPRSRSASPYSRRRHDESKDAVEQMRDLSPMNPVPPSGRGGFLRSVVPSPKRVARMNESDWDESIPIVRTGRPDTRSLSGSSSQRRPSRSESPHGRGRSASLDRVQVRGPPASRPLPPQAYRQPQQAPNPAWNYAQAPPPPPPTHQAATYYHPAHPLVNRLPASREMEQQSLITAHRRGFDMESQTGSARMTAPRLQPIPAAYQSSEFDRQSFITSHRQGFDRGSDLMERQSYIAAHRQGFEEMPAPTQRRVNAVVQRAPPPPPPPPPPPLPQQQVAFTGSTQVPLPQLPMQYAQPPQYYRPAFEQPHRAAVPVRGRSASPAHAVSAPRGQSPSPSRNIALQRAQSPSGTLRPSARRHSFEPQLQMNNCAAPRSVPMQRAPPAPMQSPPQPIQPSTQPPSQQQQQESSTISAYQPRRTELEYQQSYLMMQQPQLPREAVPNTMVQYAQIPPQYQSFPQHSQQPPAVALKPVSSRQATPGKPRRKGFLLGLKKPVGGRSNTAMASAQPTMQYYAMPEATPPAGAPVFLPEVPPTASPQEIPQNLPKSKPSAAESTLDQTIASDPLSVHDPNYQPAVSQFLGNGIGKGTADEDPVSAYGTNWQHPENTGCNVLGPVWDSNKARSTSNENSDGKGRMTATRDLVGGPASSEVESEQAQGEPTSESKESHDMELSWEERTRQAWERIRSGLIVFGEPQETSSEVLSPCCSESGPNTKTKRAETPAETRPEPVLLPDVPAHKPSGPERATVGLPADRSVINPNPTDLERQQLYVTGPYDPSKKHGILKQPSYDRRVTFGEPTEQFYDDAADETASYGTDLTAKRRRVFRGRKLLSAFFGRGLSKANKLQDSGLPHLNTRSTEASSVTGVGSVSQEWDGGGYHNYYKSHLIDGSGCDPREPAIGAHNLTCHAGLSYQ